MPYYIVSKPQNTRGEHEVHRTDRCDRLPVYRRQYPIGWYPLFKHAIVAATMKGYAKVIACGCCSMEHQDPGDARSLRGSLS
jgi:hypothetical protein